MAVATYTKTGTKAPTPVKLAKEIFGVEVKNTDMLKAAYVGYLANGRQASVQVKTRGLVSGGGRKPWRQKGTGRARFGSSRNPIWRGGGIVFGPTGEENYTHKLTPRMKRTALRQALSLAAEAGKVKVIETFDCKDGKVAPAVKLLNKIEANGNILLVVSLKDALVERAVGNIPNVKAVQAKYLNTYDVMNANSVVISKKSLDILSDWLGSETASPARTKVTKKAEGSAAESKGEK